MNTKMAEAFIRALHRGVPARSLYAIANAYGYQFSEDYGFDEAVWRDGSKIYSATNGVMKPESRKETARFFRDLAVALENL